MSAWTMQNWRPNLIKFQRGDIPLISLIEGHQDIDCAIGNEARRVAGDGAKGMGLASQFIDKGDLQCKAGRKILRSEMAV